MAATRAYLLGPVLALALLPSNLVAAAVPLLMAEWATSAAGIGWVFSAYQVGYLVGVVFLLPLTDRVRTGLVITACAAVTSAAFVLFPLLAHDVPRASALRILAGLGLAGIYLPGVRVVAGSVPARSRGFAVGAYVSSFYLGAAVSLWLTGLLLPLAGWRGAALGMGLVSVLAVPVAWFATRFTGPPPGGRSRLDLSALRAPGVLRVILGYTGHSWELYVSRGWLAAYLAAVLAAQGLDRTAAASAGSQWAALMSGLGTLGVWVGGWLSDRFGRARTALGVAVTSGLLSLVFGFLGFGPWPLLLAVGMVYGLLISADSAIYSTAVTELAPPDRLGSVQAVQALCGFGATVIAPVAAGVVLDLGLGWPGVFILGGVVGLGLATTLLPLAHVPGPKLSEELP